MMIRPYRGYVEVIEMISRRLTKEQKTEILEAYRAGDNTNVLAEKFGCTANTINRTVKTLLTEDEYKILKRKRSKISSKSEKVVDKSNLNKKNDDFDNLNSLNISKENFIEGHLSEKENKECQGPDFEEKKSLFLEDANSLSQDLSSENNNNNNFDIDNNNNFEEIVPLVSSFDFDLEKQKSDYEIHSYESLPDSVYMIVDKKVELDLQPISDLPEWSFLPENELQRNAILLFGNQRSAKRICSRNQRVIKIPNTSVFKLSKSYLISKGITRLILEDSIIALDD